MELLLAPQRERNRPPVIPRFHDVAREVGVEFSFYSDTVPDRYFLPEIMGGGAAWLDFDLDGWLDLYLMNGCRLESPEAVQTEHVNRLYQSGGNGQFVEVTFAAAAGDFHYGQGVAVGDYDADGFPDLYLCNYGANVLLHNQGDGTFAVTTDQAGVGDSGWGTSPLWLDLDGDGDLDLYATNYLQVTMENRKFCEYDGVIGYCGPGSYEAADDRVYLNQGDGRFVEASESLGLRAAGGKGLAIAALDFDHDLRAEIYVANDMMENFLFTRGDAFAREGEQDAPPYRNVAMQAGCAVSDTGVHEASMGVACADFDGDQLADVFVTHYYANKNTLYRNLGELMFHDDSRRTRIAATSFETLGFGTVPFDYDRDGATDLFITNGHVLGPKHSPNKMPPQLLRNNGQGRFADISDYAGGYFKDLWLGRGAAAADFDNDGDLDLLVTHVERPAALLRNETRSEHHWLGVELVSGNRVPPVGGRVVVTAGARRKTLPVVAGGSYLSHSDGRLLFGLGDHRQPVDVEVHWPNGHVDRHTGLAADQYWRMVEGEPPRRLPGDR